MADFNMAANMYGLYPNLYNNQIALNDLTDLTKFSSNGSQLSISREVDCT